MVASCTRIRTHIQTYIGVHTHRFSQVPTLLLLVGVLSSVVRDSRSDRVAAYLRTCA